MDFQTLQYKIDELSRKLNDLRYKTEADLRKVEQDLSWKLQEITRGMEDLKVELSQLRSAAERELKAKK